MDVFQAILNRHSVRRYRATPLNKTALSQIDDIVAQAQPLVSRNRFMIMRRDVMTGEDLIAAMGGYGRILSPPHFLLPYIVGENHPLIDLGYRMEQIAIHMVQLGISLCFIGSLGRESDVRIRFRLLRNAQIAAFLIFGYPAETLADRTINAALRRRQHANIKLAADRIFFIDTFDEPQTPPKSIVRLIEAGRLAPSANNTQPWRFLWKNQQLHLYVRENNPRYGKQTHLQQYRFFDAGTCMANITLAMNAAGMKGKWELVSDDSRLIHHPSQALLPIARLTLN